MQTLSPWQRHAHWLPTVFVVFVFVQSLFFKFSGSPDDGQKTNEGVANPFAADLCYLEKNGCAMPPDGELALMACSIDTAPTRARGIHTKSGLGCHDCHGGDPNPALAEDPMASMDPAKGFLGKKGRRMLFEVVSKSAVSIKPLSAFTEHVASCPGVTQTRSGQTPAVTVGATGSFGDKNVGSGKTVTAKTILGLLPETATTSGAVLISGVSR